MVEIQEKKFNSREQKSMNPKQENETHEQESDALQVPSKVVGATTATRTTCFRQSKAAGARSR